MPSPPPRSPWRKLMDLSIAAAGALTLFFLLWKLQPGQILRLFLGVGWGFALILAQEIAAHLFNALAWRFAFHAEHAGSYSLGTLTLDRIAGDGVNYLTPSATIAGEYARVVLLGPALPPSLRASSVLVAKVTQGAAQLLFALIGFALIVEGVPGLSPYAASSRWAALILLALLAAGLFAAALLPSEPARGGALAQTRRYFKEHPARALVSVFFFSLGYAWGAFEAYWICRFLNVPLTPLGALRIEVLSLCVDTLFFMVPAKLGTQEAGKTGIFVLLGLPARHGLAFGLIRHMRELLWAAAGMGIYFSGTRRGAHAEKIEATKSKG